MNEYSDLINLLHDLVIALEKGQCLHPKVATSFIERLNKTAKDEANKIYIEEAFVAWALDADHNIENSAANEDIVMLLREGFYAGWYAAKEN